MTKKVALGISLALLPTLVACTAILGSYEVGPSGAGSEGGLDGSDATPSEGGGSEAGDGGDGGLPLLRCAIDDRNPRVLDNGPLTARVYAFALGTTQTRVIASKLGGGVQVYTFDRNGGGPPQRSFSVAAGQVLAVRRLPNGIGILSVDPVNGGSSLGVWLIPDDATGVASRTTFGPAGMGNRSTGAFAALGSDYLFAYGNGGGTIVAGRFVAGSGAAPLLTVASGLGAGGGGANVRDVQVAGGRMYIFNDVGPDSSNGNASSGYYVLPDTVTMTGPLQSLGSGAPGKAAFGISGESLAGNLQVAAVELDLANGMPPAALHVGGVPNAKATSFGVLDVPTAFAFDTLVDAPFGDRASARFQGSDFVAMGANPNRDPGLNFLWYETKLKAVRAFNGNATKLMPTRSVSAVAALAVQTTGIFASFDVVWIENAAQDQDAATQSKLFTATMNCLR
jgi:hypothetical protein